MSQLNVKYFVFSVKNVRYAIPVEIIHEMILTPKVIPLPMAPPSVRGVFNLRGKVIPLFDLRVILGLISVQQEFGTLVDLLHEREKDHCNWISELESCVHERREFKLARDPHKCKFGIWYDNFKTDNFLLKQQLKNFDEPHQAIHGAASIALDLVEAGKFDEAKQFIERKRKNELTYLIELFSSTRSIITETCTREITVVISMGDKLKAFTCDNVDSVENLDEVAGDTASMTIPDHLKGRSIRFAKREGTNEFVILIELSDLLAEC